MMGCGCLCSPCGPDCGPGCGCKLVTQKPRRAVPWDDYGKSITIKRKDIKFCFDSGIKEGDRSVYMIKIHHTIKCSHCGDEHHENFYYRYGEDAPKPSLPDGWRYREGKHYCDRHELIVRVEVKNK